MNGYTTDTLDDRHFRYLCFSLQLTTHGCQTGQLLN